MLTDDVRVEEFDASDWMALAALFGDRPEPSGGLIVIRDGSRVAKAVSTSRGRLEPGDPALRGPLSDAAQLYGARWAARIERNVVPHVVDELARAVSRGDDALTQATKLVDVLRTLSDAGVVETHPGELRRLLTKERLLRRLVDVICPAGKTVLFGAFENGEVRTSVALHRGDHGFDRVVGPATARTEMGLVSGDFTRDARGLARAVELGVGPLALGCFAEVHVWKDLLADTTPGAWAAAVAARQLVFHPLAPALAIPLGVDIGRAAVAVARDWAAKLGVGSLFDPISLLGELFGRNR
ncbi:MAG TPA: hypothetical protein VH062_30450 [Polyangiaceae bacterium]|jgi:hypothetical protein|nr:hypothetical protein [Polyangiaceae bacterium]